MRPPALLAHSGPAVLTMPRRARTPPAPSAPKARASAPAVASPFFNVGPRDRSRRKAAMVVPASRPASLAFTVAPPDRTKSNASRRGSDCSEAIATSGGQSVALRCRASESRMAATAPCTDEARSASALENCSRRSVVMAASVDAHRRRAYRPEGRGRGAYMGTRRARRKLPGFCVVEHALEVDDHGRLVADHPGVVARGQQRDVARLAIEFRAVVHADAQHARDVIQIGRASCRERV